MCESEFDSFYFQVQSQTAWERIAIVNKMSVLPLWLDGLTPELVKYAEETLGETPTVRDKALIDFRKLLKDRPDIYSRDDDAFLLRFLRAKKFETKRAFKTFCNYHHLMTKHRGVFTGRTPSELRNVLDMNCVLYTPYRVPLCSLVWIFRFDHFDIQNATAVDMVALQFILAELVIDMEATQLCGGIHIIDARGMTLQHYVQFAKPSFLSLMVSIVQDIWPQRLHSIHFVHCSRVWQATVTAIMPLMKKKFRERIHFHFNDVNSLHQYVPKNFLPDELGGTMGPFDSTDFNSYVFSKEAYFKKLREYGIIKK